MESSGRQLSKNTKYAIVHALLGKKVRYQAVCLLLSKRYQKHHLPFFKARASPHSIWFFLGLGDYSDLGLDFLDF